MQDSSGPFDWYLTRRLIAMCQTFGIEHSRDVFKFYRSDAAAAEEAGNDIRTALICFALDGSHEKSLIAVARLISLYMQSGPMFKRDKVAMGPLSDFPDDQPEWDETEFNNSKLLPD